MSKNVSKKNLEKIKIYLEKLEKHGINIQPNSITDQKPKPKPPSGK